jgi:peroxiredoxin
MILSDPNRIVAEKYGALKENGKSIQRMVYVIGPRMVIIFAGEGMPSDSEMHEAIVKDSA